MASTDNGKQTITFRYQQEGTAEGFNKLLHKVLPTGIISGGQLIASSNSQVEIAPLEMVISDGSNVTIHVSTSTNATVTVSYQLPYIIARYNWQPLHDNFVDFEAVAWNTLINTPNIIILGKCEFDGNTLEGFDLTRRTWSSSYYENDFLFETRYQAKSPSFWVTPHETPQNQVYEFDIGLGNGIINGTYVEFTQTQQCTLDTSDNTSPLFFKPDNLNGAYPRNDLLVLKSDKTFEYIMGDSNRLDYKPECPSYALPLAYVTLNAGKSYSLILGSQITNIYNNSYISGGAVVGKTIYGTGGVPDTTTYEHTLFL